MLVGVETTMAPLSTGTLVPGQNKEAMDRATTESRSDTERLGTCCSALALASLFFARSSEMRCTRCKNALAARLTGLLRMKAMSPSNLPQPCQAATRAHKQQCKLPQLHDIPTTQVELQKLLRQAQRCPSTRQHPAPQGLDLGGLQVEVDRMRAGVERLARALEQHDVLQTATATSASTKQITRHNLRLPGVGRNLRNNALRKQLQGAGARLLEEAAPIQEGTDGCLGPPKHELIDTPHQHPQG